jgi:predicted lipid-binding transport protein (Tim44 family)
MRVFKNVLRALVLLAWSAVSVGQQPTSPQPPAGAAPPAASAERPAPPPAAGADRPSPQPADRGAGTPPPAAAPGKVDEGEFVPSEELAPDAAITFPVDI